MTGIICDLSLIQSVRLDSHKLIFPAQAAGLEVVHDILDTQATLISNPNTHHQDLIKKIQKRIQGYITATKYVMVMYNILNELIEEGIRITPGKKSPTITNLNCGTTKAVSSLILKKEVSDKMDALQEVGATDILILELQNSRM